jgi:hypothetical protein
MRRRQIVPWTPSQTRDAKKAMEELAGEFRKAAEQLEAYSSREHRKDPE